MNNDQYLQRIDFRGDLDQLMVAVCKLYAIGFYRESRIVPMGYEDLNVILETNKRKYFVKFFGSFRSDEDCERYVSIIKLAIQTTINTPDLCSSIHDKSWEKIELNGTEIRVMVMDYIEGKTFYELKEKPTEKEGQIVIEYAAWINHIQFKPSFVYDSWAISNIVSEFDKKHEILDRDDKVAIEPIVEQFRKLDINSLPHALVHGDLISTNIIRQIPPIMGEQVYFIDFSVANWNLRIQELAVLLCDLFFEPENPKKFLEKYHWVIDEYQKQNKLTPEELKALPLFAKAAHAMHVLGASYEKSQGNETEENDHWLELGRKGLKLSSHLK